MKTDQKLTIWADNECMGVNQTYASYKESPFHTGLEEMTGVNVEWQCPTPGTPTSQAFNLMLASNTLPDIIFYPLIKDAQRYIDDKVIRDLSDLIILKFIGNILRKILI
jgi:hypothetical protein